MTHRPEKPDRFHSSTNPRAQRGARGEVVAAAFLRRLGYRIVQCGLRTRTAEIDILARRGRLWIAVEVKTRSRHPAPERALEPRQYQRLQRALRLLAPSLRPAPTMLRLDLIAIRWDREPAEPAVLHFPGQPFAPPTGGRRA